MKLIRIVAVVATSVAMASQTFACCLFPWFPTYSVGYHGWGCAPAAPMYPSYGGCDSCAGTYSAGYAAYPNDCCSSSCCQSCSGGDCVSTETRKEPVEDPISKDRRDDDSDRTFRGRGYDDPTTDDRERGDDFGRGSGTNPNNDDLRPWNRSRDNSIDNSSDPPPFDENDIPGRNGFDGFGGSSSQKPPMDDLGTEPMESDVIERGANKPPINLPVDEEPLDDTSAPDAAGATTDPGTETDAKDFLPPEDVDDTQAYRGNLRLAARTVRTSHFEVLKAKRLAVETASENAASGTRMSSSTRKSSPSPRWISIPAPEGRVRS